MNVSSKVIAGCFALSAFVVAILAGFAVENAAGQIIWRAALAMIVCYPLGLIAGTICTRVIALHVSEYGKVNPVRGDAESSVSSDAKQDEEPIVV